MGLFSKDIKTLDDLFVHTLQDIYYAEKQITKALPEMIEKATDPQLKQAFQTHLGRNRAARQDGRASVPHAWARSEGCHLPGNRRHY